MFAVTRFVLLDNEWGTAGSLWCQFPADLSPPPLVVPGTRFVMSHGLLLIADVYGNSVLVFE
jgi:hypothetical protein